MLVTGRVDPGVGMMRAKQTTKAERLTRNIKALDALVEKSLKVSEKSLRQQINI